MGIFHCPLGVAFYDGDGCILCGLCIARTESEMVAASARMRAHLRKMPRRKSSFRKIVVNGKGGVGKSTVVTLMADALRDRGFNVLVIDTDESNPGLYRQFGFEKPPRPLLSLLSRFSDIEPEADTEWIMADEISTADIPPDYMLTKDGLSFIMVGKIKDPFQGCACSMADVTRDLVAKLKLAENELLLVDTEAGIESFGRGVERNADTVLAVVEPSFESMALAEKISYMADGIGVGLVKAIINKVPTEAVRKKMIEGLALRNISTAGVIHLSPEISEAGFEGRAPGWSAAREEMAQIVERLLEETG